MSTYTLHTITITITTILQLIPPVFHTLSPHSSDLSCRRLIRCIQGLQTDLDRITRLLAGPSSEGGYWPQLAPELIVSLVHSLQDIEILLNNHLKFFDHPERLSPPIPSIKDRASDLHYELKMRVDVIERVLQLPNVQPVLESVLVSGGGYNDNASCKKYVCRMCPSSFSTSGHLARHWRKHTGEKHHECPHPGCKTRTSRRDNLQSHYRIHMPPGQKRISGIKVRAAMEEAAKRRFRSYSTDSIDSA